MKVYLVELIINDYDGNYNDEELYIHKIFSSYDQAVSYVNEFDLSNFPNECHDYHTFNSMREPMVVYYSDSKYGYKHFAIFDKDDFDDYDIKDQKRIKENYCCEDSYGERLYEEPFLSVQILICEKLVEES